MLQGCLFDGLPKINEIAAVESQGFEKRKKVGGVPSDRRVYILDTLSLVVFENLFRHAFPDALPHMAGVDAQGGNPGAFIDANPMVRI